VCKSFVERKFLIRRIFSLETDIEGDSLNIKTLHILSQKNHKITKKISFVQLQSFAYNELKLIGNILANSTNSFFQLLFYSCKNNKLVDISVQFFSFNYYLFISDFFKLFGNKYCIVQ